jgi:uncharacterized membrane protein YhaH (DUF805 family)
MTLYQRLRRISRLSFLLMWIPFTTLFIGMIGMPEGSYAWAELPLLTRISLVAMGVCFVGAIGGLVGGQLARAYAARRIHARGRTAEATILNLWDTGTTINEQPVLGLRLRVQPPDRPAFEAETAQRLSRARLGTLEEGLSVRVRYLPETQEVALDLEDTLASRSGLAS